MHLKGIVSNIFRKLHLSFILDKVRYYSEWLRNRKSNVQFRKENPDIALPPDYLIYESFRMNYHKYYFEGRKTAQWLIDQLSKYIEPRNCRILDWGCGPGRIIRHLPVLLPGSQCYGTDYNPASIAWCSKNLQKIHFNLNSIEADLPYEDHFFDIIYGISILTHLSEKMHYDWVGELTRILKPGGVLLLTTHGTHFIDRLDPDEQKKFNEGQLVERGRVKEGHRTYTAFHPEKFMHRLFKNNIVLDHIVLKPEQGKYPPQDLWFVSKQAESL